MITFEELRNLVQEEMKSPKPVKLPDGFFENVKTYLEKKEQMQEGTEDAWEYESAKRKLQEMMDLREKKILSLAHYYVKSGIVPVNLTDIEKAFFDQSVKNVKNFQEKRRGAFEGKKDPTVAVSFLEDVPEFVGSDMKTYGPYKKADIATITVEDAKLLSDKKLIKKVEDVVTS